MMTVEQAKQNLMSLLGHTDLKLCWQDHVALRQSVDLLYAKAKDKEEEEKIVAEKPDLRPVPVDPPRPRGSIKEVA